VKLFERSRRRVLLSDAGRALLSQARAVLTSTAELVDRARTFAKPLSGQLRLGVIPTIAPYLLPNALPEIRRRYPELRLLLREDQTERLLQLLREGKLDLLLLALEADLGDVETLVLDEDPFLLALPRGHRLAGRKGVSEKDLIDEQVLLLDDGHCLRDQALAVCASSGAREIGDFRASSLSTLAQMVAGGVGITLLPEMSLAVEARQLESLIVKPFRRPVPHRTIGLAWRRTSARKEEFELLGKLLTAERKA
jgi:LysR family hydrogen peroxide-inducible transcriptional activator